MAHDSSGVFTPNNFSSGHHSSAETSKKHSSQPNLGDVMVTQHIIQQIS